MTIKEKRAKYIAEQLFAAGYTLAGVAGAVANIDAESGFEPQNVQNSYEKSLGMGDAQYTAAVDSGHYINFISDDVGYGICQWTASDRKGNMLRFHRARGVSIGHFETQVDWMIVELRSYRRAYATCTTSNDPYQCGYDFCKFYEMPSDTEQKAHYRGNLAVQWYNWLSLNTAPAPIEDDIPEDPANAGKDTNAPTKPARWDWKIALIQWVMQQDGYYGEPDGLKSASFFVKLREYIDDAEKC
jgi:hypothetical protein